MPIPYRDYSQYLDALERERWAGSWIGDDGLRYAMYDTGEGQSIPSAIAGEAFQPSALNVDPQIAKELLAQEYQLPAEGWDFQVEPSTGAIYFISPDGKQYNPSQPGIPGTTQLSSGQYIAPVEQVRAWAGEQRNSGIGGIFNQYAVPAVMAGLGGLSAIHASATGAPSLWDAAKSVFSPSTGTPISGGAGAETLAGGPGTDTIGAVPQPATTGPYGGYPMPAPSAPIPSYVPPVDPGIIQKAVSGATNALPGVIAKGAAGLGTSALLSQIDNPVARTLAAPMIGAAAQPMAGELASAISGGLRDFDTVRFQQNNPPGTPMPDQSDQRYFPPANFGGNSSDVPTPTPQELQNRDEQGNIWLQDGGVIMANGSYIPPEQVGFGTFDGGTGLSLLDQGGGGLGFGGYDPTQNYMGNSGSIDLVNPFGMGAVEGGSWGGLNTGGQSGMNPEQQWAQSWGGLKPDGSIDWGKFDTDDPFGMGAVEGGPSFPPEYFNQFGFSPEISQSLNPNYQQSYSPSQTFNPQNTVNPTQTFNPTINFNTPDTSQNQLLSALIQGGLGYAGAKSMSDAYTDISAQNLAFGREQSDKYLGLGAPFRERLEASYQPGFSVANEPGYADALQQAQDTFLRAASAGRAPGVSSGNPMSNPGAWAETLKYVTGGTALPYLQNYRGQLGSFGNIGVGPSAGLAGQGQQASSQAMMAGAPYSNPLLTGIGSGLDPLLNPQTNWQDMLKFISSR